MQNNKRFFTACLIACLHCSYLVELSSDVICAVLGCYKPPKWYLISCYVPKGFMRKISENDVQNFLKPYIGKVISRVRQGSGSSIFLEVDDLTIMIEWSWRVEKGNEIAFGSWSDNSMFKSYLDTLHGLFISNISFQSRLPEVVL